MAKIRRSYIDWYIDLSISNHDIGDKTLLSNIVTYFIIQNITIVNNIILLIARQGIVTFNKNKVVKQVLYMLVICKKLLSIGYFTDQGYFIYSINKILIKSIL